jgi:hypothetical protein
MSPPRNGETRRHGGERSRILLPIESHGDAAENAGPPISNKRILLSAPCLRASQFLGPGMTLRHDVLLALIMAVAMGATVFLHILCK